MYVIKVYDLANSVTDLILRYATQIISKLGIVM